MWDHPWTISPSWYQRVVSATLPSGRYHPLIPRWRHVLIARVPRKREIYTLCTSLRVTIVWTKQFSSGHCVACCHWKVCNINLNKIVQLWSLCGVLLLKRCIKPTIYWICRNYLQCADIKLCSPMSKLTSICCKVSSYCLLHCRTLAYNMSSFFIHLNLRDNGTLESLSNQV